MTIAFTVKYFGSRRGVKFFSHEYRERWEQTELFCPRCGQKPVWREDAGGDYYVGVPHICLACTGKFYLPDGVDDATDDQDQQRLTALRGTDGAD
jgi:hypothetical protein